MQFPRSVLLLFLVALSLAHSNAFFWDRAQEETKKPAIEQETPRMQSGFVGYLGHKLWGKIPKHHWLYKRVIGNAIDEKKIDEFLTIVCNFLYCFVVFIGFLYFPIDTMLFVVIVTLPVGPAIVLFALVLLVVPMVLMALYPMCTVAVIWAFHFLRSRLWQKLALFLKLDVDGDGTVDWADLIELIGRTYLGSRLGFQRLHRYICEEREHSLLARITKRIDRQEEAIVGMLKSIHGIASVLAQPAPTRSPAAPNTTRAASRAGHAPTSYVMRARRARSRESAHATSRKTPRRPQSHQKAETAAGQPPRALLLTPHPP